MWSITWGKALKRQTESRSDNETLKNKILSGKKRESLACHVPLFNTFPPDLTAVQVISKQLHGNHRPCQNLCSNSCCTSWGQCRPPGPGPSQVLNETLSNIRATGDDRSARLDRDHGCWFVTWGLNGRKSTARSGTFKPSSARRNLESWRLWGGAVD